MVNREIFIDLHNTTPPIWEVINIPEYKKQLITLVPILKIIFIQINRIIDYSAASLGDIECLLSKPLVSIHDRDNNKLKVSLFRKVLSKSKILIFDIPPIDLNVSNKLLYTMIKDTTINSTIPPKWNKKENTEYINNRIKNHPFGLTKKIKKNIVEDKKEEKKSYFSKYFKNNEDKNKQKDTKTNYFSKYLKK